MVYELAAAISFGFTETKSLKRCLIYGGYCRLVYVLHGAAVPAPYL